MREALAGVAAPTPMSHARRAGEMRGADVRGRGGAVMMTEIRGALQRDGQARARMAAEPSKLASGSAT